MGIKKASNGTDQHAIHWLQREGGGEKDENNNDITNGVYSMKRRMRERERERARQRESHCIPYAPALRVNVICTQ